MEGVIAKFDNGVWSVSRRVGELTLITGSTLIQGVTANHSVRLVISIRW